MSRSTWRCIAASLMEPRFRVPGWCSIRSLSRKPITTDRADLALAVLSFEWLIQLQIARLIRHEFRDALLSAIAELGQRKDR